MSEFIQTTKLKDVQVEEEEQETIWIQPTDTLDQVLKVFLANGIISAPVFKNDKYETILNMLDISEFIVKNFEKGKELFSTKISEVMKTSKEGMYKWKVSEEETLEYVVNLFGCGVHRVLLGKDEDKVTKKAKIMTQTDVLKFIFDNAKEFSDINKSLEELDFYTINPISITMDKTGKEALELLTKEEISALAIVDENEKVIGTFSSSDVRLLTVENLQVLNESLDKVLKSFYKDDIPNTISVKVNEKLCDVLKLILDRKVHRLWVCDANDKLVGLVSLTDIIFHYTPQKWRGGLNINLGN